MWCEVQLGGAIRAVQNSWRHCVHPVPTPCSVAAGRIVSWQACPAHRSGLLMEALGNMNRRKTRFPDIGPEM